MRNIKNRFLESKTDFIIIATLEITIIISSIILITR
jgi:hypothetical protein